jgi:hypothetical protein
VFSLASDALRTGTLHLRVWCVFCYNDFITAKEPDELSPTCKI